MGWELGKFDERDVSVTRGPRYRMTGVELNISLTESDLKILISEVSEEQN